MGRKNKIHQNLTTDSHAFVPDSRASIDQRNGKLVQARSSHFFVILSQLKYFRYRKNMREKVRRKKCQLISQT